MISDDTARAMGIKFLREERGFSTYHLKCEKLACGLEAHDCLDETFAEAIKTLGKKKVLRLYTKLPEQLRKYVLWVLCPKNDRRFEQRSNRIYTKYPSLKSMRHPDRGLDFEAFAKEFEGAILKYLVPRRRLK